MRQRGLLTILLLFALLLLLGGVHRPEKGVRKDADPVRIGAESLVRNSAKGAPGAWRDAAAQNPVWILQINAR